MVIITRNTIIRIREIHVTKSGKYLVDRESEPPKQPFSWSGVWKFYSFSGINSSSVDKIYKIEYDDKIYQINLDKIDNIEHDKSQKFNTYYVWPFWIFQLLKSASTGDQLLYWKEPSVTKLTNPIRKDFTFSLFSA